MLKVDFFHVCDMAILEQGTGKFSIIGVFGNINSQNFPAVHPSVALVVGLASNAPGAYDVELVIIDEKSEILKVPAKVNIEPNLKGVWIHKIVGYKIPRESTQKIKLNYGGETIHTGYLTINNK